MERMMQQRVREESYDDAELEEQLLTTVVDIIEDKLGKHLESATPDERIEAITTIQAERGDIEDDESALYEGMLKMATLEKMFHAQSERLSELATE